MIAKPNWKIYAIWGVAIVFMLVGILRPNPLYILSVINWNVLMMIGGTMLVVWFFIESKMPNLLADIILDKCANVMWVIILMSLFAGAVSAFIDNVATVLMIAPVALAVCKKLDISPVSMILSIAVSSNLQGAATLVGDTTSIMLGDYAKVAPVGMICRGDRQKDAEAASPTLAGLKGKRFVTMSESNEYGKLDEEKIKQLTGGEEISARALYQSAITFKPQFTLWLSCNDLPMVTDKSLFASERIKVIEFNRHFSPKEQGTHLKDELTSPEAMSGIFMWLVRGYIRYKERGLVMADNLKEVVSKYERDNDLVLQFLESRCDRDENSTIKAKDLYNSFKLWAKSEGAYVLSARKFNSEMERHPEWFDRKSTSSGFVIYWGLKMKEVV